MPYERTAEQMAGDRARSHAWEAEVEAALGPWVHSRTDSANELDYWWPGFFLDAKEKRQRLTERWHLLSDVAERDLFVIDELSVRKALKHYPEAYFIVRDVPGGDRLFLSSVFHVVAYPHVRVQRGGKGKWVVDLNNWRQVARVEDVPTIIQAELTSVPWKSSECLSLTGPLPQV